MRFTPARPSDAAPLACILSDWIDEQPWMPKLHTPEEDERFLAQLIAEQDVRVLRGAFRPRGFLARADDVVHALYLCPTMRGRGHGKRLLNQAKAQRDRLTLWAFQANTRARAFYAREGFREVAWTDGEGNDEKLPDVRLEWERAR